MHQTLVHCPACGYGLPPVTSSSAQDGSPHDDPLQSGRRRCPECGLDVDLPKLVVARDQLADRCVRAAAWMILALVAGQTIGKCFTYLPRGGDVRVLSNDAIQLLSIVPAMGMAIPLIGLWHLRRGPDRFRTLGWSVIAAWYLMEILSVRAFGIESIRYTAGGSGYRIYNWTSNAGSILAPVAMLAVQRILFAGLFNTDHTGFVRAANKALYGLGLVWVISEWSLMGWQLLLKPQQIPGTPPRVASAGDFDPAALFETVSALVRNVTQYGYPIFLGAAVIILVSALGTKRRAEVQA